MPPCVDAQLQLAPSAMSALLQLPDGWRVPALRVRNQLLELDVVFPDGPTEHAPIQLIPYYRHVYHEEGRAQLLDRIEVVSAIPDRPTSMPRRWLMGEGWR